MYRAQSMKVANFIAKIHDWFSGEINRDGEKQLEAFSRKDDFAREALEGYRSFPEGDHQAAIDRIKSRLNQKNKEKSTFGWMRIAASLLVLVVAGSLVWWMMSPSMDMSKGAIAKTEKVEVPTKAAPENQHAVLKPKTGKEKKVVPIDSDVEQERTAPSPKESIRRRKTQTPPPTLPKETVPKVTTIPSPEANTDVLEDAEMVKQPAPAKPAEEGEEAEMALSEVAVAEDIAVPSMPDSKMIVIDGIALDTNAFVPGKDLFTGIVKSTAGKPLEGVKITAFGTNVTTLTNINGRFVVEQTPEVERLLLEAPDYKPLVVPVAEEKGDVALYLTKEISALGDEEAFMRGLPQSKSKKKSEATVAPVGGYENFGTLVLQSIKYPEEAKKAGIEGDVELSFVVLPDGSISNIRILNSPDKLLSLEAIRIFKQLPRWNNTTGNSRIITYAVPFRIE